MAYSPPKQWTQGEVPTAALMNLYDQDLDELHSRLGDYAVNYAIRKLDGENYHIIVHRHQWLHYKDDGYIEMTTGTDEEIAASRVNLSGTGFLVYNLDSVSWLIPGTIYRARGVDFATESPNP